MPSLIKERGHSLYSPTVELIVHYRSPSHGTEWEGSRSTVLLGRAVSIFPTLAPTVGHEGSPTMAGKRTSTTRPRAEPPRRGRPRRAVRSTYANVEGEGSEGSNRRTSSRSPTRNLLPPQARHNPRPRKSSSYCRRSCRTFSRSETESLPPTPPAKRQQ
jgi:hypothetical protein